MFLHDAVLEAIICGETEIPTDKYQMKVIELKEMIPSCQKTGLKSQFDILSQVTPDPDNVFCDTAKAHSDKNRSNKYLPCKNFYQFLITLLPYNYS